MQFNFNFYSSLLLITFSQGIIYTFLLLKKGFLNGNRANFWLGFFILLCSLYIAPWMLGFAGWYDNQPYRDILFYMPFQHLYFMGPIIYFYTQSLLNLNFKLKKQNLTHFLPGILFILLNAFYFVFDYFIEKNYYFYADGSDKDFDIWYQITGSLSMIFYLIITLKYYNNYKKFIFQTTSFANSVLFSWVKNFLICFLIMIILPYVFNFLTYFYPNANTYKGDWWFF